MGEGGGRASAIYKPQPYISHPPLDRWLGWKLYGKGFAKNTEHKYLFVRGGREPEGMGGHPPFTNSSHTCPTHHLIGGLGGKYMIGVCKNRE